MTDKLELSTDNPPFDPNISEGTGEMIPPTPPADEPTENQKLERKFDERFDLFMNQLSKRVEEESVPIVVAVLIDPKFPSSPMVFKKGHIYDQARLLADTLRALKLQIEKEISV